MPTQFNTASISPVQLVGSINPSAANGDDNPIYVASGVSGSGATTASSITLSISTTTAYSPGQSVGGVLTFPRAFGNSTGGIVQNIDVNISSVQTASLTFVPCLTAMSNSTFTDHSSVAIGTSDINSVRDPVSLFPASPLGTHTNYSGQQLAIAMAPNSSTIYGILVCNSTSNVLSSTGTVFATITTIPN